MTDRSALAVVVSLFGLLAALGCQREGSTTADEGTLASLHSLLHPQSETVYVTGAAPVKVEALESMTAARKLIRTGQLVIEVASYQRAAEEVTRLVEALGGYLADTRSTRSPGGQEEGTLTARIPASRFAEALAGLKSLGTVQTQTVSMQDVGKAYADLETRLRVKRDTAERLRAILKTRAAGLPDILAAERELARVIEETEQMEGERRFYDQQVALSTLTVKLLEPEPPRDARVLRSIRKVMADSHSVLETSVATLVYVTILLSPWLLVAGVVWAVVMAVRRHRRRRSIPASPPGPY